MRDSADVMLILSFVSLCLIFGGIFATQVYLIADTDAAYTITVNEKWIKAQGQNGQKYLMSDAEGNVYSIEDSYWKWIFDASNRYAAIKPGHTYHITTFGRRSPFFSNYPNAITIEEVNI